MRHAWVTFLTFTRRQLLLSLAVTAATCLMPHSSFAQTSATASMLKAAFLYNFAKFTDWPEDALAPGQRLVLCVLGDAAVSDALEQTIKGRSAEGHELIVQAVKAGGAFRSCHLLYTAGLDAKRSAQLVDELKGTTVFTVGDADSFCESGGIAQLVLEHDRMRFAINVMAAERARLHLSSKLLSLATIVKERTDVQR
jgi:hypothetical protein